MVLIFTDWVFSQRFFSHLEVEFVRVSSDLKAAFVLQLIMDVTAFVRPAAFDDVGILSLVSPAKIPV